MCILFYNFQIIASANLSTRIAKESIEYLKEFLQEKSINVERNGRKLEFIYERPETVSEDKEKYMSQEDRLTFFVLKNEDGKYIKTSFRISDFIILSYEIEKAYNNYKYEENSDYLIDIAAEDILSKILEAKNIWYELNANKQDVGIAIENINSKISKLEKDQEERRKKLEEEKSEKRKKILQESIDSYDDLIERKKEIIEMITGRKYETIINKIKEEEQDAEIADVIYIYEKYIKKPEQKKEKEKLFNIEENILKELEIIAENSARIQINKKTKDELIDFIENSGKTIKTYFDEEEYVLGIRTSKKGIFNQSKNSNKKEIIITTKSGKVIPIQLSKINLFVLNHFLQKELKEKETSQSEREILPEKKAGAVLTALIDAKDKFVKNNEDEILAQNELNQEIKDLTASKDSLRVEQSRIDDMLKETQSQEKIDELKEKRRQIIINLNQINLKIRRKELSIKIVTKEITEELFQKCLKSETEKHLKNLTNLYKKACDINVDKVNEEK